MAKKSKIQAGAKAIQAIFADGKLAIDEQAAIKDPNPNEPREFDGKVIMAGRWDGAPHDRMPPGCPVRILGKKGETVYAVSATGELMEITKWDTPTMALLFAPYLNYLYWAWPAWSKEKKDPQTGELIPARVERLAKDQCVSCLINEAGRRGIFDPAEQRRGRGGWRSDDDAFVWHSGKYLWMTEIDKDGKSTLKYLQASEYQGYFYAQDSSTLVPWQSQITTSDSPECDADTPAHEIQGMLMSWNWERPWLDPILYLGWHATAIMGAALKERPIVFVTGGHGRGKSTLHDLTKALMGSTLISSANTSAAGIYQKLKYDSRPVMVDEFEARARGDKEQAIIEIARIAYSGQNLDRGGQNHDGVSFTLRCSFGFSAIIPPPMTVQDRSRMAIMNLKKLNGRGEEPMIKEEWGRMMLRQVMDGWRLFQDELLPKWYGRLGRAGFSARAIETYGGLIAGAELLVGEVGLQVAGFPNKVGTREIDEEDFIAMIRHATRSEFIAQEEKWETVMDKILSAPINNWKAGEKPTVGSVLERYERTDGESLELHEARHMLALAGLWLFKAGDKADGYTLAIPRTHDALEPIFRDTEYRSGGWYQALKQAPEDIVPPRTCDITVKMGKLAKYCLLVDMAAYDRRGGVE